MAVALAAQLAGQTVRGGQLQGTIVDPEGAVMGGVRVSVLQADSNVVAADVTTDRLGKFKIGVRNSGSYTIKVRLQGFRSRALDGAVVREDETVTLPDIQLDFAGCDAPGVNCDIFLTNPKDFPQKLLSAGYLKANLDCEIDLRKSQVYCTAGSIPRRTPAMDLKIVREDARIFLKPLNGAAVSAPNSSKTDCSDAKFSDVKVRVDGLGPGYDMCVRTHEGHPSHVFLVNDVGPTSSEISLWQVTRKR